MSQSSGCATLDIGILSGQPQAPRAGNATEKERAMRVAAHRDRFIGNVLGSWVIACCAMDAVCYLLPDTPQLAPLPPVFELMVATGVAALAALFVPSLCGRFAARHAGLLDHEGTHYAARCGRLAGLLLGVLGDIALQWI
ncbi:MULTISPECIES: hypothetical protein [Paraburkholderia]|uniref:hypothetical protein n=1 Tax=Paraburkholderia TaxID=1822464 RepID=UPI0013A705D7|nr:MULTISPECIES: hypothetical protein [Paraburkholderia]MDH6147669.1 hypothetical protein [Paraburkholderia sp. WSM4179]